MTTQATILIVDDEEHIRYSLKRILKRDGYYVVTAESGKVALQLIDEQEFDLALIDIKLTDISGMELLEIIRKNAPDTVVIVLTGYASLETSVESLRQGAHDYLFKPTKPTQLRESIRTGLLERQQKLSQRQLLAQLDQLVNSIGNLTGMMQTNKPILEINTQALESPERFIQRGDLIIDTVRHVITIDEHLLEVSPTEFEVLFYLAQQAPQVVKATELINEVQGYDSELWEAKHIARQYIYRLRQKIKETAGRDNIIRTVRGQGYTINM
jgi:DNA-binding response OmpR family regulator